MLLLKRKDLKEMGTDSSTELTALFSKIAADSLLGKIRFDTDQREPRYLQPARVCFMQLKRTLGPSGFDTLSEELRPSVHALVDLLFDACTGLETRAASLAKLKNLPLPQRMLVENAANKLTGRLDHRDNRWMDELWALKRYIERVCVLSTSGISPEEIREGFDPIVHLVVDRIYDQRKAIAA